jgi:outer membrane protein TolC
MANLVKDDLAMRLTLPTTRLTRAAVLVAWSALAGCQKLPYIDQSKAVPRDNLGTIAQEDKEVKQADFLSSSLPLAMPRMAKPRTTNDPETKEIWQLTLQDAIKIGLDNSEVVRVISLGAQGIPVGGFEPTPLIPGSAGGIGNVSSILGGGTLSTIYDPAIQETQIASALSFFDTNFTTQMLWGHTLAPVNNAISAGTFIVGQRFPLITYSDTGTFSAGVSKRTATGATIGVTDNVSYLYNNFPNNVFPSVYTTNLQFSLTQPLLGSAPLAGQGYIPGNPNVFAQNLVGLEANRAPIIIARLTADNSVWQFKLEVMAEVRSIEQQYWSLAQQHVQLWAAEKAVELAEEILKREQSELEVGRGTVADVAESQQQLERFRLNLVTKTSDVLTTERQLRNLLGLPPADDRRIVPVTAPTEARLEPDWDASLAQMLSFKPDIVQQQINVRVAELSLLVARNQLLPQLNLQTLYQLNGLGHSLDAAEAVMTGRSILAVDPRISAIQRAAGLNVNPGKYNDFQQWQIGLTLQMPIGMRQPLSVTRFQQYGLLRQRAFLQQIVHQSTHQLARFFLEIDANYKQFKTASRFRAAAAQRLEAQRAFYEEGRITIDRYLNAVSEYADAVAQEAQFKTSYNISIIALEEAKGTLLAYDNIAVAEGPHPAKAYIQARDQQAAHRQFPIPRNGPYHPTPINGPPIPDPVPDQPPSNATDGIAPPMPAPVGPLAPQPTPVPPTGPAGEPNIHTSLPAGDGGVVPAASDSPSPVPAPETAPDSAPASIPPPSTAPAPASAPPAAGDLPALPESIELPPLPKG